MGWPSCTALQLLSGLLDFFSFSLKKSQNMIFKCYSIRCAFHPAVWHGVRLELVKVHSTLSVDNHSTSCLASPQYLGLDATGLQASFPQWVKCWARGEQSWKEQAEPGPGDADGGGAPGTAWFAAHLQKAQCYAGGLVGLLSLMTFMPGSQGWGWE